MSKKKLQHYVDHTIVDLIMEHYNIQSFEGMKENMSGEEFKEILEVAKAVSYTHLTLPTILRV